MWRSIIYNSVSASDYRIRLGQENIQHLFKLWHHQQIHNSIIYVLFLLFGSYVFWHRHHPQGAYTNIPLKHTAIHDLQ